MVDFQKIVEHPESRDIIAKLVNGKTAKEVSNYLKDKYAKPEESHLRIPANTLQEFLNKYADQHLYVKNIISKNADNKLEKKIADSLLDNRVWKERLEETVGKEIDYFQKLDNVLSILETRAEQLFDHIQSNPEDTRTDYIFTKYMEMLMLAIEKGDKLRNDRPDIKIEHTYTVQMVEQQAIVFQDAIRRVLERMSPEYSSLFMEMLNEEIGKINSTAIENSSPLLPTAKNEEKNRKQIDKLVVDVNKFEKEFEDNKNDK